MPQVGASFIAAASGARGTENWQHYMGGPARSCLTIGMGRSAVEAVVERSSKTVPVLSLVCSASVA